MTDLIQRARTLNPEYLYGELVHELANEIERLRREIERLHDELYYWKHCPALTGRKDET
jgi:uncharacterized small protein (DUF1192 family)